MVRSHFLAKQKCDTKKVQNGRNGKEESCSRKGLLRGSEEPFSLDFFVSFRILVVFFSLFFLQRSHAL